jgi:hypothetical protein
LSGQTMAGLVPMAGAKFRIVEAMQKNMMLIGK